MCKSEIVQSAQVNEQKQVIPEYDSINLFWGTLWETHPMLRAKDIDKMSSEPKFRKLHLYFMLCHVVLSIEMGCNGDSLKVYLF